MFNFWTVTYLLFVGVIAGLVARLIVPGRDAMGCLFTILSGIVGSFAGGFLAWALFGWGTAMRVPCSRAGSSSRSSGRWGSSSSGASSIVAARRADERRRREADRDVTELTGP